MHSKRLGTLVLLAGVVTIAASGCGGGTGSSVAVSIGDAAISRQEVAHWTKAVGLGAETGAGIGQPGRSARERALEALISTQWLKEEAADRGLGASDGIVERRLHEKIATAAGGEPEFEQEISSLGETIADVKRELGAELASAALSRMVSARVRPVTGAEVGGYYQDHQVEFRVPELRLTDLIESIPTRAAAIALGERLGSGSRFAGRALHEKVEWETPAEQARRDNARLVRLIFAARPGTVAGPVRFRDGWVLVVVRKVVPARVKPLAAVEEGIAERLAAKRRRVAVHSFTEAYRRKWIAKTDCRPGFVVRGCSQYKGRVAPEGDPLSYRGS